MTIITSAVLSALFKTYSTIFNEAFAGAATFYKQVASVVPSTTREQAYAWLGAMPKMREWVGDRVIENLKLHGYSILNKDWEATVSVDRNDIADDGAGVYSPLFSELGRSAAIHPDELISALIASGFSELCFDGQYFFDTDHPVGDGTVSNFDSDTGTAWYLLDTSRAIKPFIFQSRNEIQFTAKDKQSDDNVFMRKEFIYGVDRRDNAGFGLWQMAFASKKTLNATNYAAARAAMMSFKNDSGQPLGITPNLLLVPPTLEAAAKTLLAVPMVDATTANPWYNSAKPLVSPFLA